MSKNKPNPDAQALERAKREEELARERFTSTLHTLQYRLKPGTLANDAWNGVKEKSGALADDALQAVKDRPVTASGIVAAVALFLARDSLWALASRLWRGDDDSDLVKADLKTADRNYDLATPQVSRSVKEGVSA